MASTAVAELKKEFEKLVGALVEEDEGEYSSEITDDAIRTLCALKDLKLKRTDQEFGKLKDLALLEPPQEFKCPMSGVLMTDPVVLSSGQTYEGPFIRKWLNDGNEKCPQTGELLPHTLLIPNHSIGKMITNWCGELGISTPMTTLVGSEGNQTPNANRENLLELLEKLSSVPDQTMIMALKELRFLTEKSPHFRSLFGEVKVAIPGLFSPVLIQRAYSDAGFHNDLVATILNIATHHSNRAKIVERSPLAVSFLINSSWNENIETRRHAVAALSVLSFVDSNKHEVGQSCNVGCLIELIREVHDPLILKDAILAISNICTLVENKKRVICGGGAVAIMERITITTDISVVEVMLEILAVLCGYDQRAMEGVDERRLLSCLFGLLLRDEGRVISDQGKENCVAIIYAMCFGDRMKLRMISQVENGYEALCRVARNGTSRARRKAVGILERMNRFAFVSYSA